MNFRRFKKNKVGKQKLDDNKMLENSEDKSEATGIQKT